MNLCYLLEMIDYLIEFDGLMDCCLDEWDKRRVLEELLHFRRHGRLSGEYMTAEPRAVFRLLLQELKAQIQEADPDWFEAWTVKDEDRARDAQDAQAARDARNEPDGEATA